MFESLKKKIGLILLKRQAERDDEAAQKAFMLAIVDDRKTHHCDYYQQMAFRYAKKYCNRRDMDGMYAYCVCVYEGIGLGDETHHKGLALEYLELLINSEYEKAIKYVLSKHEEGNDYFDYTISMFIYTGVITQYDIQYAITLAKNAMTGNKAWGCCVMALFYKIGMGLPKDEEMANDLLKKAESMSNGRLETILYRIFVAKCIDNDIDKVYDILKTIENTSGFEEDVLKVHLAKAYLFGLGVESNHKKAWKFMQQALSVMPIFPTIEYMKAMCYHHGICVDHNDNIALNYAVKASTFCFSEIDEAYKLIAELLLHGKNVDHDIDTALKYATQANELKHGQDEEVKALIDEINQISAIEQHRNAADNGDAEACFKYAAELLIGAHIEKNVGTAIQYLRQAVNMGDTDALYWLGMVYSTEDGFIDHHKAIEYLSKAAENYHPYALYRLGLYYKNGIGIEVDMVKALECFAQAANQGVADAQIEMGDANYDLNGQGDMSYEWAYKWFKKAADQGNHLGQYKLALCYKDGIGIERDIDKAIDLLLPLSKSDIEYERDAAIKILREIM